MRDLSGYAFSLLRAGELTLHRGSGDGLPPILRVTAENGASLACLNRLEHEYALRADLDAAWAAAPLELSRNRLTLILHDPGGGPLDRLLGRPLEVTEFLRVGISIASALRQVHERKLMHRDIKPANVLVDAASGAAWLTGFGIASRLPRERQNPEAPEAIAGTLAYMAPEQTGRMNRSIDSRSDLYSLGVTFYEMLTGTLPFTASDPMEWVHCHIARQPLALSKKVMGLPAQLSSIIMKLLAKTAEERYQTAGGLQADLCRCLEEWLSHGRIEPFPLGARDTSEHLLIPEKLYGREHEIETLLASFDRVVNHGMPEFLLVSGYSGIGKSSVVNELHKVLVSPRGFYASGKFDQYKRDIPYVTLAQALQSLVRSLLSQGDEELGRWRDSFGEALGSHGQLIVNLIPELEIIVGKQPAVTDLPPREAKNRFQTTFRRFLGAFASKEHPLVLFIDDLQWLDGATLDLLEHLITHSEMRYLLLIGAYRDNEVGSSHPLVRTLEAIRKTDACVREIVLTPLGIDDVGRLIADAVHCRPERATGLAQLVQEKTGGNPFFSIQFLTRLADEELLAYDRAASAWIWDTSRIDAKDYTDNVADLIIWKLKRLSISTQDALVHLACLGNMAETRALSIAHQRTEDAMNGALWEAVRAGLIVRQGDNYKFLHDRIHQAAYSLLPEEQRPAVHLRIGRLFRATMTADEIQARQFEVANQFNRGAALLVDSVEKTEIATLNLRTGAKAKASAAYGSARAYFAAGTALLDDRDWQIQHELKFSLSLENAECELLCGSLEKCAQQIAELLQHAASDVEFAVASCLKINLHVLMGEHAQAVDSALACLRLFGINLPTHPSPEQVWAEYETVWQTVGEHPIESLIDLPLMTDPKISAAMQVLSYLAGPATFTDFQLFCLLACRMVNISIQHGMSGPSAYGYGCLGSVLGANFRRYREGYRLARLACDLVEKHAFTAYDTKVSHAMGLAAFWTEPLTSVIEHRWATTRAAAERGDLTFACYGMHQSITYLLMRNDPLDAVWNESERALDFARTAKFRDVVELIESQQRYIATMQGRDTASGDQRFDEATFEEQLTATRTPTVACLHWIRKLKVRYLSGEYFEAQAAANKAKALLLTSAVQLQLFDYFYYSALAVAALYEEGSTRDQSGCHELLTAHGAQLREWAEAYAPTFGDKHALVSAEIARIEGRDADAMRLYEHAIDLARVHQFVQNEALAYELTARFYAARGVQSMVHPCVRNARQCYLRWGAFAKVRHLERLHPWLTEEPTASVLSATIDVPVAQFDAGTVVKASQAVSSEVELGKLIETLLRISLEHAGAGRGLLILFTDNEPRIAAEAMTGGGRVEVTLREAAVMPSELPETVLRTVIRTRESVLLDDAAAPTSFSQDMYVQRVRPRSVLCLPLLKQGKLVGAVYLENKLTPRAFTSAKFAVLKLLASQAAISLENVRLYEELRRENAERRRADEKLRRSEAYLSEAQRLSHTGTFAWWPSSGEIYWSEETFRLFDYDPASTPTLELITLRVHPDDAVAFRHVAERAMEDGRDFDHEYRLRMADGKIKHLHVVARCSRGESGEIEFVGAVMDVTAIRLAELELHKSRTDLAHETRVTSLGELTASIAHEVNQPLGAVMFNAEASLGWLDGDPPNMSEARAALERIVRDGTRAGEIIRRVRALAKKTDLKMTPLNLSDVLGEALTFVQHELINTGVQLRVTHASTLLAIILADRVQLQQVILNLVMNAIEAMQSIRDRPRELTIQTELDGARQVLITVTDCGIGFCAGDADRLFNTFFTTKSGGMGMGLSICRSIIEVHGGRIWAEPNLPNGATLRFTLPLHLEVASRLR